jgi:phytoene dehydrogenase-like protein
MTDNIVIVGGGHNGLVCAAYLAKAGRSVQVLEAADQVGGAAITREFAPGFRVSACAHLLNLLDAGIYRDLKLADHGLEMANANLKTIALAENGHHLTLTGNIATGAGITAGDQATLADYHARMVRFSRLLASLYRKAPPRLSAERFKDLFDLGRLGLKMRMLGRDEMREFMRIVGINIYDVLQEQFEHPLLKGTLGLDAVLGNHLGPRSNNSVFNALHRLSGELGGPGNINLPRGGMGTVSDAVAAAARGYGATIRTGSVVSDICMQGDRIKGVLLESGESVDAGIVISNVDPKTTFLDLLGARNLEAGFADRVNRIRCRGNTAKLHLALNGRPNFTGLDDGQLGDRLIICPDLEYLDRAFDHAKYGEYSSNPAMEITLPSIADPGMAPEGQQVLSAVVQYAPHALKGGWETQREAFQECLINQLGEYAPGLREQIVAVELLTPVDIEREFRITGGHWHHGELTLDQALFLRPVPEAAQHATPIDGLYLCGAGSHPGGGVMGSAGRNAAAVVMENGS